MRLPKALQYIEKCAEAPLCRERSYSNLGRGLQGGPWIPAVLLATLAAFTDWQYRRVPNWLTVSGAAAGIAVNAIFYRWTGVKAALLGMAVGLALLLPFVLVRSLGAGDWKLAGALGACLGWRQLLTVLMGAILVAGVMAFAVVIWKGRLKQTLLNIAHMLAAFFSLRMPGPEVSLDNPRVYEDSVWRGDGRGHSLLCCCGSVLQDWAAMPPVTPDVADLFRGKSRFSPQFAAIIMTNYR